jgi:pimeloyl-ACP methyl ester carboxylesterase
MDEAGFETAHVAGNSLGGYLALKLAERGRARSVVALAPAGGWAPGDDSHLETLAHFDTMQEQLRIAAPHAESILATPGGRRGAAALMAERWEHIAPELLDHIWHGVVACHGLAALNDDARRNGWPLEPERVMCPVRIVWGTADRLLTWPRTAERYRAMFPHADWVELDGVGHGPQLDVPLLASQLILGFTAP